jgi:flagellar biogenesis protein FliO
MALCGYFIIIFHRRHGSILMGGYVGKSGNKNSDQPIEFLQKLPIGSRQFLAVVKCNNQQFLVGVSQGRIDAIGEIYTNAHKVDENSSQNPDIFSVKIKN